MLISATFVPAKGQELGSLDKLGAQFHVAFDLNIKSNSSVGWSNLLVFNGLNSVTGENEQIFTINVEDGKKVKIGMSIDGKNKWAESRDFSTNNWNTISMDQNLNTDGQAMYR